MGAEVRMKKSEVSELENLEVVGHGEIRLIETPQNFGGEIHGRYSFLGTREGAGPASMASLREALLSWRESPYRAPEFPLQLFLADASEDDLPHLRSHTSSPSVRLEGERLLVCVSDIALQPPDPADLRRLFAPFLGRHGASCHDVVVTKETELARWERWSTEVLIDWPIEGRIVAEAWSFAEEAKSLLLAAESGELTQETALDLLRAGKWDLFLEQPESEWLEAKQAPYQSSNDVWKNELAKDVATFANRPGGGVIVLGMRTEKENELDVIKEVKEIDLSMVSAERYRKVIGEWVYPEVDGFAMQLIPGETEGRGLVALLIPPQPPSSLPFLVKGMVKEGRVRDHYILLPFRRADETAFSDIASIHVRLRLGQQALKAEQRPRSGD